MKKFLLALLAVLMFVPAISQTNEFPKCSFWSNWSVGGSVMYTKDLTNDWAFGEGSNVGIDVRFVKQLNYNWQLRLIGTIPGFITSDTNRMDRYGTGLIGFAWYPWANHFYAFADGGIGVLRDNFGYLALAADAGIGLNYNICEHSTIFGELGIDVVADFTKNFTYDNLFLKVGYAYRFGMTATDKAIMEQKALLVMYDEQCAAERDSLQKANEQYTRQEKELIQKIMLLEEHDYILTNEIAHNELVIDSLTKIIQSFEDNKTNYYALPFSIQFDLDSYRINAGEMNKVKAVARMMVQDTTIRYTVAGFCDASGSDDYNMKLSGKRAEAVKKALMRYGVKEDQIDVQANGKSNPFVDAELDVNRRVSFYRN